MDAEYFEREYSQIVREWKCASTDDEKWSLRARMAKLERTRAYCWHCTRYRLYGRVTYEICKPDSSN